MNILYLNGEFLPREQASISVFDRGFLFGDAVYEVVPVFEGLAFLADEHLVRLEKSLKAIQVKTPLSIDEWKKVCRRLIAKNNLADSSFNLYIQVSRGADPFRGHAIRKETKPTFMAMCMPAHFTPMEEKAKGFKAITLEDTRRRDCYIKSTSLLPNVLLYEKVQRQGALEAVLHRGGYVTEGTLSNVFVVKDGEILTPPESPNILSGITRDIILKLAKNAGLPSKEVPISLETLMSAEEIWVTGSSKEICPIVQLDNKEVGDGTVGPMWEKIMGLYEAYKITSRESDVENSKEQQISEKISARA